jgi:hypothetical protein
MREWNNEIVQQTTGLLVLALYLTCCSAQDTRQDPDSNGIRATIRNDTTANISQFANDVRGPSEISRLSARLVFNSNRVSLDNGVTSDADNGSMVNAEPSDATKDVAETNNDTTDPFFVTINGQKYFGGMETLSIKGHPSKICHVLNPCLRVDGTILLPKWMVRYDELLDFHCGMQETVKFSLPDTEPPAGDLLSHDLFGVQVPMLHAPFFLFDIIPAMVSLEAAHRSLDEGVRRACYARSGRSCTDFPQFRGRNMKPALFIDERAKLIDESKSWVRQFLRLMTPRYATTIKELYMSDLFPHGDVHGELKCFRSMFVTKRSSARTPVNPTLFSSLQIFKAHDIEKEKRDFYSNQASPELSAPQRRCTLNVTILNRKPDPRHPDRALGRYIPNIPQIRRELRKLSSRDTRIDIRLHSLRLDGRSMRWQINAMQKTDLLVAGHGASITNMIFMRQGSSVLELQPFAYYPDTYRKIAARIADVLYAKYIAKPDPAAFHACMNHYYPKSIRNHDTAHDILARFDQAAAAYNRSSTNTRWLLLHATNASMESVKTCAQMQRLDVYAKGLAERAFDLAKVACGIRGS